MDNEHRCAGVADHESVAERFSRLWTIEDVSWFLGGVTPEFVRRNLPEADPDFPAPFKLGTKLDRWDPDELTAWRARKTDRAEGTGGEAAGASVEVDATPGATARRHQKVARTRRAGR